MTRILSLNTAGQRSLLDDGVLVGGQHEVQHLPDRREAGAAVGTARRIVAGGQESMSSAPHYVYGMRGGIKAGNQTMVDGMMFSRNSVVLRSRAFAT